MGREIKRVPLDLIFTVGELWPGYDNPHQYPTCPACDGRGTNSSYRALETIVRLLMLAGDDSAVRPKDFRPLNGRSQQIGNRMYPHPFLTDLSINPIDDPGDELHLITAGLCGRSPVGDILGHCSSDNWRALEAIVKAAGQDPETWGNCKACNGQGWDPARKAEHDAYNAFEETPPPQGDGWQLWSTTTEGTPMTPVFATPEELARHCADNGVSSFGSDTASYETWLKFITGPGLAPSAVFDGQRLRSGVEGLNS